MSCDQNKKQPIVLSKLENTIDEHLQYDEMDWLQNFVADLSSDECEIIASPNDYHNIAVSFAYSDKFYLAAEILEYGLKKFPGSIDLIADFLNYGSKSGQIVKCDKYYAALKKIPTEDWTWRGYDFSIMYLTYKMECERNFSKRNTLKEERNKIVTLFVENRQSDERAYMALCETQYKENPDEQIKLLDKYVFCVDTKVGGAPRCALKYAEIMIDLGRYDEALEKLNICKSTQKAQETVNPAYVHYLCGLCLALKIQTDECYKDEDRIRAVYQEFKIALDAENSDATLSGSYKKMIRSQINILEVKSPFKYKDMVEEEVE